jgi:hypothetical protein
MLHLISLNLPEVRKPDDKGAFTFSEGLGQLNFSRQLERNRAELIQTSHVLFQPRHLEEIIIGITLGTSRGQCALLEVFSYISDGAC